MYYTTVADVVSIPSSSSLMLSDGQPQSQARTRGGGLLSLATSSSAFPLTPEAALSGGGDQQQISSPVALSSTNNNYRSGTDESSNGIRSCSPNAEYFRQRRRELELEYYAALESTVPPPPAQGSGGGRGGASKSTTATTTAASNSNNKGADGCISSPTNHKGGPSSSSPSPPPHQSSADSEKSGGLQAELIATTSLASPFQNHHQQHQASPHPQLVNANHPRNATITKAFKQKLALLEEEERTDMQVWGRKIVDTGNTVGLIAAAASTTTSSSATRAAAAANNNNPASNKGGNTNTTSIAGGTTAAAAMNNNNNTTANSSSTFSSSSSTHILMSRQLPPPPSASEIIKETLMTKFQSLGTANNNNTTTTINKTNTNLSPLGDTSSATTANQQQLRSTKEGGPQASSLTSSSDEQESLSSIERVISDGIATDPILRGAFDSFEKVLGIIEDFVGAKNSLKQQQQQKQQQTNERALGFVGVRSAEAEQLAVVDREGGGGGGADLLTSLGKLECALLPSASAGSLSDKQQQNLQRRRFYILRNLFLSLSTERKFLIGDDTANDESKEEEDTEEKGRAFNGKAERDLDGGGDEEAEAMHFMGLVLYTAPPKDDDDSLKNAAPNAVARAATRSDTTNTASSTVLPTHPSSSSRYPLPKSPDSLPLPSSGTPPSSSQSLCLPPKYISALVLTYKRLRALIAEYLVLYFSNRVVSLSLDDSYGPSCGLCEGPEVWQRGSSGDNNRRGEGGGGGGGLCVCGIHALMNRKKGADGSSGSNDDDDDDSDTNEEPSYYYYNQQEQQYHQKTQTKQSISSNGSATVIANNNNSSKNSANNATSSIMVRGGGTAAAQKSSPQLSSMLPSARVLNLIRPPTPLFVLPSLRPEEQYKGQADELSQRRPPRRRGGIKKTLLPAAPLFTLSGVVSSGVTVTVGCVVIPHVDTTQCISRPTGPHRQVREAFLRLSSSSAPSVASGNVAGSKSAAKSTPLAGPTATPNNAAAEDTNTTGATAATTANNSTLGPPLLSPTSTTAEVKEHSHGHGDHDKHQHNLHSVHSLHQSPLHSTVFPVPYVTGGEPELLRHQLEGDAFEKAQLRAKIKATEATIGKTNAFREFRESQQRRQRQRTSHNGHDNNNIIKKTRTGDEEAEAELSEYNSDTGTEESTSYSSSSGEEDVDEHHGNMADGQGEVSSRNNKTTTSAAAGPTSSPPPPQASGGVATGRTDGGDQQIQQSGSGAGAGTSQPPTTANNAKDKSASSTQQQQQSTTSPAPSSAAPISAAALLQILSGSSSSTSVGSSFSSAATTTAAAKEPKSSGGTAKGGLLSSAPDGEGSSFPLFSFSSLSSSYPSPQSLFEQFSAALRENAPDLLARNFYESALLRLPIAATTQPMVDALIAKAANKWILAGKALDQVVSESLRNTGLFVLATAARYVFPSKAIFVSTVKAMLSMVTSTLLLVAPRDGGLGFELLWQKIEQLLFSAEDETTTTGNKYCWTPPPSVASGASAAAGGSKVSGGSSSQQQQQQQQQLIEPLALAAMAEKLTMLDQVLTSIGGLSVTVDGGEEDGEGEAVRAEGGGGKLLPPAISETLAAIIQQQTQNNPSTTNLSNNSSGARSPLLLESLSDEGLANLSPATIASLVVMCTGALISLSLFLKYGGGEERGGVRGGSGMVTKEAIQNDTKKNTEKGGSVGDISQQQQQHLVKMMIPLSIPSCVPNRTLVRRLSLMLSCWTAKAKTLGCRHDGSRDGIVASYSSPARSSSSLSSSKPLELYEGFSTIFSGDGALSPLAARSGVNPSRNNGGGPSEFKNMVGKPFGLPTPIVRYDTDLWQVLNSSAYSEAIEQASKRNGLGEYAMQEGASSNIIVKKNNANRSSGGGGEGATAEPLDGQQASSYALGARAALNNRTASPTPAPLKSMSSSGKASTYYNNTQKRRRITLQTPSGVPNPITLVPKGLEMMMSAAASSGTLRGGGGGSCRSLAACFEALSIVDSALRSAAGLPMGRYSTGGKGGGSYPPWELYDPHHHGTTANNSGDTNTFKGGTKKVVHSSSSVVAGDSSSSSSPSSGGVRTLSQCLAGGLRAVHSICSQIDLDEEDSDTVGEETNIIGNKNNNNTNTTVWYRYEREDEEDTADKAVDEGGKGRFELLLRKIVSTLQPRSSASSLSATTSTTTVTIVFAIGLDGAGYPTLTHFVQELAKIRRVAAAAALATSSATSSAGTPLSHRLKIVFDLRDIIAHAPMIPGELSRSRRSHGIGGGPSLMPLLRVASPQTVADLAVGGAGPHTSSSQSIFSPTAVPQFLQAVAKKRKQLVESLAARSGGIPTPALQADGSAVGNNTLEGEDQPQAANIAAYDDAHHNSNTGSKDGALVGVGVVGGNSLTAEGVKQCTATAPQQTTTTYLAADISSSTAVAGSPSHSSSSARSSTSYYSSSQQHYQSAACFWLHFSVWCDVDGIILPPCRGGHVSSVYNEMLRIEERLFS